MPPIPPLRSESARVEPLEGGALDGEEADAVRGLAEQSLVGIYIIQDGRFVYANARMSEVLGYSREELTAAPSVADFVIPEDREVVEENVRRRMAGEVSTLHYNFRGVRKDGTVIDLEVRGKGIRRRGRPAIIGTLLDVTENKKSEDALRRSERRFRTLFGAAADGILLVSPSGDIVDLNPSGAAMFDAEPQRLLGHNLLEFISAEDAPKTRAYLQGVIQHGSDEHSLEIDVRSSEGGRHTLAVRSRYVREDGCDAYVEMVARDVTEQREMQRRLIETERLASMGQMAAYVAHEINTPLANISLLTAASLRATKDPALLERLEKINVQRRRAASIISNLLSISKQREIQARDMDLRGAIISAADQVEAYRRPEVELQIDVPPDLDRPVLDSLQIQEVFANLLKNAFEATVRGRVVVRVIQEPEVHRILVTDTGVGIPSDLRARIFEPFFTTKRVTGGTGLGLVFCKKVVKAHGGGIQFESEAGQGTTFSVVLPRRK